MGPDRELYRGGIAQFTSELAEELSRSWEVTFVSWSRLYPSRWIDRTQSHDPSADATGRVVARRVLSISNPLTWYSFAKLAAEASPRLVVLTWIHPIHAPVFLALRPLLRRNTGAEIVYLCHNVLPHESFPGARLLARMVLRGADRLVVHGAEQRRLAEELGGRGITALNLPLHDFFTPSSSRLDDQPKTGRPALLFFGAIRDYKGVDLLLRAMPTVLNDFPEAHLTIAGEPFFSRGETAKNLQRLIKGLGIESSVTTIFRYIEDREISALFGAADVAVFPYRSASQSGALTVAYAHGVPVIAGRVGGLGDVVAEGTSGYLVEPNNVEALAHGILKFTRSPISRESVTAYAERFSWSGYIRGLVADTV